MSILNHQQASTGISIPRKIASYDSFAIILMSDEESLNEFQLPAELDPLLSA